MLFKDRAVIEIPLIKKEDVDRIARGQLKEPNGQRNGNQENQSCLRPRSLASGSDPNMIYFAAYNGKGCAHGKFNSARGDDMVIKAILDSFHGSVEPTFPPCEITIGNAPQSTDAISPTYFFP